MSKKKKKNRPKEKASEQVLDFEEAKEMTVGEAVRRQEEIKAGISEEDGVLDRYIKQHRTDIEAEKFETLVNQPLPEEVAALSEEEVEAVVEELPLHKVAPLEVQEVEPRGEEELEVLPDPETAEWNDLEETSKAKWIWAALLALLVAVGAGVFLWTRSAGDKTKQTTNSSSRTTSQTSSSTTSSEDAALAAFETLYKSFFTDATLTKLKNSEFGKLPELKAALDKIGTNSKNYAGAKEKYDRLEKAIAAVQAMNAQFDKAVIADGELDTTATVKAGASFIPVTTGISGVDATLTAAINFGRSQEENAAAVASQEQPTSGGAAVTAQAQGGTTSTAGTSSGLLRVIGGLPDSPSIYGIALPAGVTLQRDLSRVPYDEAKIADSSNEAWDFNPGVLERIVATSQQRGYIVGNQYILDRVTIINGNGYYNMFKPDGTYLFSINAKTGYFVGNGSGYSDALDY